MASWSPCYCRRFKRRREAARRSECQNNLKQIGLATQNFAQTNGHLPPPKVLKPGAVLDSGAATETNGSTFVLLLPFLEEASLYAKYEYREVGPRIAELGVDEPADRDLPVPVDAVASDRAVRTVWRTVGAGELHDFRVQQH